MKRYTEEVITNLEPYEVFVFGSNEAGGHGGGSALTAYKNFGAKLGTSFGLTGSSFAIPTVNKSIEKLDKEKLLEYLKRFIQFAKDNKQYTFLFTKIGCGIAGFKIEEIRELFWKSVELSNDGCLPNNIVYPIEFELF